MSDTPHLINVPDQQLFVPHSDRDKGLRVLVIDDDPLFSSMVCRMLASSGYTAVRAAKPDGIVSIAATQRLDAVLLDCHLGKIDGLTVCRELRRHPATSTLAILMMTGLASSDEQQVAAARLGVSEFLFKPFDGEELRAALTRALANHQPTSQPVSSGKVLIIDDDPTWPELLSIWLEGGGYKSQRLTDARLLGEALREIAPDCVILDYLIDGHSTEALCKQIRSLRRPDEAQIIVHSAHSIAKVRMLQAGADHFVEKSGAPDELMAIVRVCVQRTSQARVSADKKKVSQQSPGSSALISKNGISIDLIERVVKFENQASQPLSGRELRFLCLLVDSPDSYVSHDRIREQCMSASSSEQLDLAIHTMVRHLKDKLPQPLASAIRSSYGTGYKLDLGLGSA